MEPNEIGKAKEYYEILCKQCKELEQSLKSEELIKSRKTNKSLENSIGKNKEIFGNFQKRNEELQALISVEQRKYQELVKFNRKLSHKSFRIIRSQSSNSFDVATEEENFQTFLEEFQLNFQNIAQANTSLNQEFHPSEDRQSRINELNTSLRKLKLKEMNLNQKLNDYQIQLKDENYNTYKKSKGPNPHVSFTQLAFIFINDLDIFKVKFQKKYRTKNSPTQKDEIHKRFQLLLEDDPGDGTGESAKLLLLSKIIQIDNDRLERRTLEMEIEKQLTNELKNELELVDKSIIMLKEYHETKMGELNQELKDSSNDGYLQLLKNEYSQLVSS